MTALSVVLGCVGLWLLVWSCLNADDIDAANLDTEEQASLRDHIAREYGE